MQAKETRVMDNGGFGAVVRGGAAKFLKCHFDRNAQGILKQEDGCKVNCSQNTAPAEMLRRHNIPGFRVSEPRKAKD